MAAQTYSKSQCYRKREYDKEEMLKQYCPLIKCRCREDCACFSLGKWTRVTNEEGRYYYYPGYCRSPLITGDITMDNGLQIYYP